MNVGEIAGESRGSRRSPLDVPCPLTLDPRPVDHCCAALVKLNEITTHEKHFVIEDILD